MSHNASVAFEIAPNACVQIERSTDATTFAGKAASLCRAEELEDSFVLGFSVATSGREAGRLDVALFRYPCPLHQSEKRP
jgi:hypothetical protein